MEAKKINLQGIVRKPQNRASEDGACAEIINLRNWDGAWETVGDKEQIEELESGATQVTFHPINEQYEAYAYRLGTDIKAKIIDKVQGTSTIKTLLFDIDSKVIMKPFYNVLLISLESEMRAFIFELDINDYTERPTAIKYDFFELKSFFWRSFYVSYTDHSTLNNKDSEYAAMVGAIEKAGYVAGEIFMAIGARLSNGDIVKITPFRHFKNNTLFFTDQIYEGEPASSTLAFMKAYALDFRSGETIDTLKKWEGIISSFVVLASKPNTRIDYYDVLTSHKNPLPGSHYIEGFGDFINIRESILNDFKTLNGGHLGGHKAIPEQYRYYYPVFESSDFKSIANIKIIYEVNLNEIGKDEITLTKFNDSFYWTADELPNNFKPPYRYWFECDKLSEKMLNFRNSVANEDVDNNDFYIKVLLATLSADHQSSVHASSVATFKNLTVFNIEDAAKFDSLPGVELLLSPHGVSSINSITTYDDRLLLAGVKNKLSGDLHPDNCIQSNSLSSTIKCESAEADSDNYDPYLVYDNHYEHDSLLQGYYVSFFFYLDIESSGYRVVQTQEILVNTFSASHTDLKLSLGTIMYPDIRAKKVDVYIRVPADMNYSISEDAHMLRTFQMEKHDFLPIAYVTLDRIFTNKWESDRYTSTGLVDDDPYTGMRDGDFLMIKPEDLPEIKDTYKDLNRVQASSTGTVFSFPAKYSYRIGMDEVMNVTSITDEMSQGQFGQFPLIAFTKGMIWAMEIGQGDVFISNIVPLANEVCNSHDTITVVRGGILFSTTEGLKILQGKQVNEISEAIEGPIQRLPIHGKFTLNTILDKNGLTEFVDDTAFKDFLIGAKIGYNYYHDELILSSDAHSYSYLYSLKTGLWTKITEKFDGFTNQFPHNFGIKDNKIYDLSSETRLYDKKILVITRPFKLTPDVYKKIEQVVIRGEFSSAEAYLFACTEGSHYRLVSSGSADTVINQLHLHRTPYSAKTFILALVSVLSPEQYIGEIDVLFTERFTNKLR